MFTHNIYAHISVCIYIRMCILYHVLLVQVCTWYMFMCACVMCACYVMHVSSGPEESLSLALSLSTLSISSLSWSLSPIRAVSLSLSVTLTLTLSHWLHPSETLKYTQRKKIRGDQADQQGCHAPVRDSLNVWQTRLYDTSTYSPWQSVTWSTWTGQDYLDLLHGSRSRSGWEIQKKKKGEM